MCYMHASKSVLYCLTTLDPSPHLSKYMYILYVDISLFQALNLTVICFTRANIDSNSIVNDILIDFLGLWTYVNEVENWMLINLIDYSWLGSDHCMFKGWRVGEVGLRTKYSSSIWSISFRS